MRIRVLLGFMSATLFSGCARDQTITHGADGKPEWDRRLRAAVPIGAPIGAAQALERNGFDCRLSGDSIQGLWCDKRSGGTFVIVSRRWIAIIEARDGRVSTVGSNTGLIGP